MARGEKTVDVSGVIEALDALSASDLTQVIKAAQQMHGEKLGEAKKSLIAEMREKAQALGFSMEDLMERSPRAKATTGARGTVAAKYKFPSGGTWSGRGKLPKEAAELKHQHGSLEGYLIKSH